MRYQQKQKLEREQKKNELITGRSLAAIDSNDNSKMLTATIGNGKVNVCFDGVCLVLVCAGGCDEVNERVDVSLAIGRSHKWNFQ